MKNLNMKIEQLPCVNQMTDLSGIVGSKGKLVFIASLDSKGLLPEPKKIKAKIEELTELLTYIMKNKLYAHKCSLEKSKVKVN